MDMPVLSIAHANDGQARKLADFLVAIYGESERALAESYIKSMFSNDMRRPAFIVALHAGRIVGAASYSEELFTVGVWGISWVAVDEALRNKGIGGKLVDACLEAIRKNARLPVTVLLNTYPGKTEHYDKLGFTPAGHDHAGGALMIKYLKS